ncbi:MAG TPA: isochorismate lyase [Blastocatellia bacterium]
MKPPAACTTLQEIRAEIDRIDRDVIAAFGQRFAYVKAATKFKTSQAGVKASDRFAAMLQQRREWAAAEGLNPEVIEKLYRDLVTHFIEEELKQWHQEKD